MIVRLTGTLLSSTPLSAVVEANGVGYEVHVPLTTTEKLPAAGARVLLHTYAVYREDSQTLYGFHSTEERDFFRLLVEKVTGIGPKLALSVLSRLSLPVLQSAIVAGDVGLLAKCPGIGKKTAERLVIELRDKLGASGDAASVGGVAATPAAPDKFRDAVLALVALGYKAPEADKAIRDASTALGPSATTEALIKQALG
jgi:Holliday junction DNA helicase RuvA